MILSPNIDGNELTGPIPTEVDLLTTLRSISIGKRLIVCFNIKL